MVYPVGDFVFVVAVAVVAVVAAVVVVDGGAGVD